MRDGERDRIDLRTRQGSCGARLRRQDPGRAAHQSEWKLRAGQPARPSQMRSSPPPETSPTASRAPRSPRVCWTDCPGPSRSSVTRRTTSGTPDEFARCYEPTWGRHRARTRPAVGNHEYGTPGAAGYFDVLRCRCGRGRQGLVQLRPRRLARGGAQLQLHPRRRVPGRVRAGALAARRPGRHRGGVHARLHAPSSVQLRPACTAAAPRSSHCGARSRTRARSWCWPATTTTTSASPRRRLPARSTSSGACVSSWSAQAGGPVLVRHTRAEQRGARQHHLGVLHLRLRDGRYDWRFVGQPGSSFADTGTGQLPLTGRLMRPRFSPRQGEAIHA